MHSDDEKMAPDQAGPCGLDETKRIMARLVRMRPSRTELRSRSRARSGDMRSAGLRAGCRKIDGYLGGHDPLLSS